ncbi:SDR family oxidoreductase [Nocardioides sp. CN2-186]|uniref:SDR family oxidoreductase n=1 Tax=Nocardioides tweenelious TaxID=3156607 RepID=UPI0032B41284
MQGLDGKVAIVTGASRGIGLGIAQRLVDEGVKVCLTARKPEALEEAVAALGADNAIAVAGKADDPEHRADAVRRTIETFGSLDLLVNNAGINPVAGPLVEIDLGAARKIVEVNALGALAWVQEAHRAWMAEHGGAIVNISSLSGLKPAPGIAMYGASKAMMISLTESLAVELGPGIRVNAVAPAVVKTQFASLLYEGREAEVSAAYPLKRLGVPEDVAGSVAFLLSDDAGWLTGQTITLDGGVALAGGH